MGRLPGVAGNVSGFTIDFVRVRGGWDLERRFVGVEVRSATPPFSVSCEVLSLVSEMRVKTSYTAITFINHWSNIPKFR